MNALVAVARRLADDTLAPAAEHVDRTGTIPASHVAALAEAGLFGIAGPADAGGADLDPATARRVVATIGGACGATFFVWVQHHGVVRTLRSAAEPALRELVAPLCAGETIGGTAFAHVRRPGTTAIAASRVDGGWRLDGRASWATSWGIAGWFTIAAVTDDGRIVWAVVPGDGSVRGLRATPLELPVLGATGTVVLDLDGCVVADDRVAAVESLADWRRADRRRAALGQPATIGIAERCAELLAARHDDREAADAAGRLRDEIDRTWARDLDLLGTLADADGTDDDGVVAAAGEHRAACIDLARRATTALLAASGGGGMDLGHPAQRLAREADFYVVQAQTADGRRATLRSIAERPGHHG